MFTIVGSVSASDSSHTNTTISEANSEPVSHDNSQSLTSESPTTQIKSSADNNEKQTATKDEITTSNSQKDEEETTTPTNDDKLKSSPERKDKLKDESKTIWVSSDGTGDGSSEENPINLDDAMTLAQDGDTINMISGNYQRNQAITLNKNLTFIGAENTIITKTGSNNLFTGTITEKTVSFNNIIFSSTTSTKDIRLIDIEDGELTLKNCKISNIDLNNAAFIRLKGDITVTIDNCEFYGINSSSGSAACIYIAGSSTVTVKNSIFHDNIVKTDQYMRALIYNSATTSTTIVSNCTFYNNKGNIKAIIDTIGGPLTVTQCIFKDNNLTGGTVNGIISNTRTGASYSATGLSIINTSSFTNNIVSNGDSIGIIYTSKIHTNISYCAINLLDGQTAIYKSKIEGDIFVENNWYGTNNNPNDNTILKGASGVTIKANNWIVEDGEGGYELNGEPLRVSIAGFYNAPEIPKDGVYFVSPTGTDDKDGLTEANATSLTHALRYALPGNYIYMLDGAYTGTGYKITKNITIIGKNKNQVTINAEAGILFNITNDATVTLNNLIISRGNVADKGLIYNNNGTLTLDTITLKNNINANNLIYNTNTTSNLTIINSKILDNKGNIIFNDAPVNITIKDTLFENNDASETEGILYIPESTSELGNINIENSQFINNTGNKGILLCTVMDLSHFLTIKGSEFINNTNKVDNPMYGGGAVTTYLSSNIIGSTFINNKAKLGGAIFFMAYNPSTISNSVFINNTAENDGDAIYNMYEEVTADNNYWGTNDNPKDLVEDVEISKWIIMNVTTNTNTLYVGDDAIITVDFTKNNAKETVTGGIPELTVTATAVNGNLNTTETKTINNIATFKYTAKTKGTGNVTINTPASQSTEDITINEHYTGVIYVSPDGDDKNNGSDKYPVQTIKQAINLTQYGSNKIVIRTGIYNGYGYNITKDLEIIGQGNVVIDANGEGRLFQMAYGTEINKLSLINLTLTGAKGYGAAVYTYAKELVLDNITIKNIKNPITTAQIIQNSGNIIIKNSNITNNNVDVAIIEITRNGNITIKNTTFENNIIYYLDEYGTSKGNGVIYYFSDSAKGNLIIENSKFNNNTAFKSILKTPDSSDDFNITVKNSEFINNNNTGYHGGIIYTKTKLDIINSTFINNKAKKNGGVIDIGANAVKTGDARITQSIFINNTATENGDVIYNQGQTVINYCVILTNNSKPVLYNENYEHITKTANINAQFNWWGNNTDPKTLVSNATGSPKVDTSKWVIMTVDPSKIDLLEKDAKYNITVKFTDNTGKDLSNSLPELTVTANATIGQLNATKSITKNNIAKFKYTIAERENDIINITSGSETISIPVVPKNIYDLIDELNDIIDDLNKTIKAQNDTLTNLTRNNTKLNETIKELEGKLSGNATALKDAQDLINQLKDALNTNATELQKAQDLIEQLKENLKNNATALNKLNSTTQDQINNLTANSTQLQKQISDLESKLTEANTKITELVNLQKTQSETINKLVKQQESNNANTASTSKTTKLTLKNIKSVKKSAKKLVLTATLKVKGKAAKNKKVRFTFNGKKYTRKTNKKGVAKLIIKKSVLKKLKVGKKVKYTVKYGKKTVKRTLKVKK